MPTLENSSETEEFLSKDWFFDIVIVGSGPAGAVVASELVRKGRRVVLLEAGGRLPETDFSNFLSLMARKKVL